MLWYKRSMPTIGEVLPHVKSAIKDVSKIDSVNSVSIWGSLAKNISNLDFRIKDIDLLIKSSINSSDLLAIGANDEQPFSMSRIQLEEIGFNPDAVEFTKNIKVLTAKNFDIWVLSKNSSLLHWCYTPETIEEWRDIRKKAEKTANISTGMNNDNINKYSDKEVESWLDSFNEYIKQNTIDYPIGWYESLENIERDSNMFPTITI